MNRWTRGTDPNFVSIVNTLLRLNRSAVQFYFQIRIDAGNPVNAVLASQLNHWSSAGRALWQTDLNIAIFTSADANDLAHDDFRRSVVKRRDVNYQPVYLLFCHRFREVSVAVKSNQASASKTAWSLMRSVKRSPVRNHSYNGIGSAQRLSPGRTFRAQAFTCSRDQQPKG